MCGASTRLSCGLDDPPCPQDPSRAPPNRDGEKVLGAAPPALARPGATAVVEPVDYRRWSVGKGSPGILISSPDGRSRRASLGISMDKSDQIYSNRRPHIWTTPARPRPWVTATPRGQQSVRTIYRHGVIGVVCVQRRYILHRTQGILGSERFFSGRWSATTLSLPLRRRDPVIVGALTSTSFRILPRSTGYERSIGHRKSSPAPRGQRTVLIFAEMMVATG